jgi:hypothetical protein
LIPETSAVRGLQKNKQWRQKKNINQDSDIEKRGDSSEELDDDTVHQNVLYKFVDRIKS